MLKNITIIGAFLVVLSSCGSKKAAAEASGNSENSNENKEVVLGKSEAMNYESLGNDIGTISLQLFENNTFKFNFKSIPQPGTDEKPVKISEKGKYSTEGDWSTLYFNDPKFSLSAIFDTDFGAGNDFKVIDDETVKVNTSKKSLSIWGILCEKK